MRGMELSVSCLCWGAEETHVFVFLTPPLLFRAPECEVMAMRTWISWMFVQTPFAVLVSYSKQWISWACACIFRSLQPIIIYPITYNKLHTLSHRLPRCLYNLGDTCVCRRVKKEARVCRNAALETVVTTAGTPRGASLSHHHGTRVTIPLTGERHLSAETHTFRICASEVFQTSKYFLWMKVCLRWGDFAVIVNNPFPCIWQFGLLWLPLTAQSISWCCESGQQWWLVLMTSYIIGGKHNRKYLQELYK